MALNLATLGLNDLAALSLDDLAAMLIEYDPTVYTFEAYQVAQACIQALEIRQ